ncbi:MAG: hypothetical protein ACJ8FY_22560 [Gemmataceae bacterium]
MSFVHNTVVGHFNAATLFADRPLKPVQALDRRVVEALLAEYPAELREYVEFVNGYVAFHWSSCQGKESKTVRSIGYRLAEQEKCIAAESPLWVITYPQSAEEIQRKAAIALLAEKRAGRTSG